MIVRVVGHGQYEVAQELVDRLNALDEEAVQALQRDDEGRLDEALEAMSALVREQGTRLPDDALSPSEIVIPPSDLTLEETRKLLSEQGFLPDPITAR